MALLSFLEKRKLLADVLAWNIVSDAQILLIQTHSGNRLVYFEALRLEESRKSIYAELCVHFVLHSTSGAVPIGSTPELQISAEDQGCEVK
mmetsp:Transcript_46469/g.91708  ORF Transcript_46469/g.91708 Transcript_46469/m.91708 type:complete len:91 (-) Transcript_46469:127-399(-)